MILHLLLGKPQVRMPGKISIVVTKEHHSYFTSLPFMVLVGINKKRYYLHRSVLSRASPYFDKLLQFPGAEVHRNVVSLSTPVDTENAFNMFVNYCYHKDYKPAAAENTENSILTHVEVYTFAERVCMTDLKETALNKLSQELRNSYTRAAGNSSSLKKAAKTSGTAPTTTTVLTVSTISTEDVVMMVEKTYSHTPSPDSAMVNRNPLRTLVVRFCASCLSQLRVLPAFMELVRDFADFEDDLFREVKNGATLKAGKAAWLNWLVCPSSISFLQYSDIGPFFRLSVSLLENCRSLLPVVTRTRREKRLISWLESKSQRRIDVVCYRYFHVVASVLYLSIYLNRERQTEMEIHTRSWNFKFTLV